MSKKWISILLFVIMLITMGAVACADDELDISADTAKVEELGIPTASSVTDLKTKADSFWDQGDYTNAALAYAEYAKQANWLANLISSGCDPFYGSSSNDTTKLYQQDSDLFFRIGDVEKSANSYKAARNYALTRQALCYYKLGDYNTAVPLLTKALGLLEIDQTDDWKACMNALYDILGVSL